MSEVKEKKSARGLMSSLRIIKNTVFAVILVILVTILIATLIARVSGKNPSVLGYSFYRVSSGSMLPTLEVGDIILVREWDALALEEGDIITYEGISGDLAGKMVTHRVVVAPYESGGSYYLVTKGDNNPAPDTAISVDRVLGKVVTKLSFLNTLYDFFISPWGLVALIGLIVLAFFNEIVNFIRALMGLDAEEKFETAEELVERYKREEKDD